MSIIFPVSKHFSLIKQFKATVKTTLTLSAFLSVLAAAMAVVPTASADMFISSFGTDELMRFDETTGQYLGNLGAAVNGPFASQIGFDGDLFVSSFNTGEVLRFDSITGEYLGAFITAGHGGLSQPTAPNFGPDGKVYVGGLASHRVLRYDANGQFIDVFADGETSPLNGPFMQTFDATSMYIASGHTNSILRYDLATKEYLGEFVPSGSGGVVTPVGLEFGPDGHLYTSSAGTSSVLRYHGKTGEFIDEFVPPGSGGMDSPRAIRFGGPNNDLYVVSSNTVNVLRYDRVTGEFLDVIIDDIESGFKAPRGLTFSPRPEFRLTAKPASIKATGGYKKVRMSWTATDFTDESPDIELLSVSVNNESIDVSRYIRKASYGTADNQFKIRTKNKTGADLIYTIMYRATNEMGESTLATTTVTVRAAARFLP
ncbi:MAG: outer membrane protein assembly factor BamB [Phenylobacterium sp.]|jgi:outer membrane protein assembly factor BamB